MDRMTDDDLAPLGFGMIWVAMNACHRIHENRWRFLERDAVLGEVGDSLRGIPLEYDPVICYRKKGTTETLLPSLRRFNNKSRSTACCSAS